MRWEFQLRVAGAEGGAAAILIDTTYADIEDACGVLAGPEPAWLDFFMSPAAALAPYEVKLVPGGRYSKEEALSALGGLRSCLERHGGHEELIRWLGWAEEAVGKTRPEARFDTVIQDD
ncbi:MAG: hypothetical protein HYZ75_07185 [Elusimicrobia bacterium]|nr:hypothetical protein [Elusimicrobiota bacterium]